MSNINNFELKEFYNGNEFKAESPFNVPKFSGFLAQKELFNPEASKEYHQMMLDLEPRIKEIIQPEIDKPHSEFVLNGFRFYDLFDIENTNLSSLKNSIVEELTSIAGEYSKKLVEPSMHSWLNILRKNQFVPKHCHVLEEKEALSFVLFLSDSNTEFEIEIPHFYRDSQDSKLNYFPSISFKPTAGSLIIFPSWIFHFTKAHKEQAPRVSIAGTIELL